MRNKSYAPYISAIYIYQYRFIKFPFIACKSFQKILYRCIDKFYTWCMLQYFVKKGNQATHKKQGRYPPDKNDQQDKNNKVDAWYINILMRDNGVVGKKGIYNTGEDTVYCFKKPYDRINCNSNRYNKNKTLQKELQGLIGYIRKCSLRFQLHSNGC